MQISHRKKDGADERDVMYYRDGDANLRVALWSGKHLQIAKSRPGPSSSASRRYAEYDEGYKVTLGQIETLAVIALLIEARVLPEESKWEGTLTAQGWAAPPEAGYLRREVERLTKQVADLKAYCLELAEPPPPKPREPVAATGELLPRMPLPAHLRRDKEEV